MKAWSERFICRYCERPVGRTPSGILYVHGSKNNRCLGSGKRAVATKLADPARAYAETHAPSSYDGMFGGDDIKGMLEDAFNAGVSWQQTIETGEPNA